MSRDRDSNFQVWQVLVAFRNLSIVPPRTAPQATHANHATNLEVPAGALQHEHVHPDTAHQHQIGRAKLALRTTS